MGFTTTPRHIMEISTTTPDDFRGEKTGGFQCIAAASLPEIVPRSAANINLFFFSLFFSCHAAGTHPATPRTQ